MESRRFAGHSHWQNVRHIKAEKDTNKSKQTDKHARLIQVAVATGGGPDPRLNRLLSNAIENAKRTQVVTNTAIEAAIKRASSADKPKAGRAVLYELIGEHGALALASCEVHNISKFVHTLKLICKKNMWGIAKGGVKERFEEKGFVSVCGRQDEKPVDADEALEFAIEGGAEDVMEYGEGASRICEFVCTPRDYFSLQKVLQNAGYIISDAGTKYTPHTAVSLEEEQLEKVSSFCDELEEQPEVLAVHTNLS